MKKEYLGIDLGSDNTSIYSSHTGTIIFSEPTCIALDRYTKEVKEVGFLASRIAGKTPFNYETIYPVRNGVIEDDENCYLFLDEVFKTLKLSSRNKLPALVFAAPSRCSKVNRRTLIELGKSLGAKEIYIESQARLSALGFGKNVFAPTATLVCNIGSGISDIACLSMGEVVAADSCFVAGDSFDEAIRRYMMQKQHLAIGLKSAEYIKMKIGSLRPVQENKLAEVRGRDTLTSLPSSVVVSASEIRACLEPLANIIALKITDVIASVPPELAADLMKNGILLTGGGALVVGIKEYFEKMLSIPVRIHEKPTEAINDGFAMYYKVLESKETN